MCNLESRWNESPELHTDPNDVALHNFGANFCFICGLYIPQGSEDRSEEHIFPKWLLKNWIFGITRSKLLIAEESLIAR